MSVLDKIMRDRGGKACNIADHADQRIAATDSLGLPKKVAEVQPAASPADLAALVADLFDDEAAPPLVAPPGCAGGDARQSAPAPPPGGWRRPAKLLAAVPRFQVPTCEASPHSDPGSWREVAHPKRRGVVRVSCAKCGRWIGDRVVKSIEEPSHG